MLDLLQESIKGYNLPFTILVGCIFLYWIIALFGVVDIDAGGDFDIDTDIDADTDIDGAEGSNEAQGNFLDAAIRFVGFSDAPLMFVISIFAVMLWVFNLIANIYFNPAESNGQATILLLPVIILGFITTRLLVRPLRPLMKMIKGKEAPAPVIGEQGVVVSSTLDHEFGRVQIDFEGRPLLLNATVSDTGQTLSKGDIVLVVSQKENQDSYIVRSL